VKSEKNAVSLASPFPLDERIGGVGDLLAWFNACCAPESRHWVGIEVERLGVDSGNGEAVTYSGERGIESALEVLASSYGWSPKREDGHIIQLKKGACYINLEPGGQLEVSGSPEGDLHAVKAEQDRVSSLMGGLGGQRGVSWIGCGMHPYSDLYGIEWVPKGRYRIMSRYFKDTGSLGHRMMKQTASVQASFNYFSEEDALNKMKLALVLSPVATAMFANSPISNGAVNGFLSSRAWVWSDTDPARCGMIEGVLAGDGGFRDYIEYALSVPMLFVVREGRWVKIDSIPFRDFMNKGAGGHHATYADWELHLTTLFPDVRMKHIVEVRSADAQRPEIMMSVPAFWKGILYDRDALEDAWERVGDIGMRDLCRLVEEVPKMALGADLNGERILGMAKEMIELSRDGLIRQGKGEEVYLEPLEEMVVEREITPAEDVIERWEKGWREDPAGFIEFHSY